jgi:hypothetical protein
MSDKVPVQQELAANLANLLLAPMPRDRSLLLLHAFLLTLQREWTSIDQLRMDKFMTLVRRFIHRAFLTLGAGGWQRDHVEELLLLFSEPDGAPLSYQTNSRGFFLHITDVWLTEIERAAEETASASIAARKAAAAAASESGEDSAGVQESEEDLELALPFSAVDVLLTPFYHALAMSGDQSLVARVQKEVWDPLVELCKPFPQPKLSRAQKQKLRQKQQKKQQRNGKRGEDEMDDDEEEDDEEDEEEQEEEDDDSLHAQFPHIASAMQGAGGLIGDIFFELASQDDEGIRPRTRKLLYAYAARFRSAESEAALQQELQEQAEEDQRLAEQQAKQAQAKQAAKKQQQQQHAPAAAAAASKKRKGAPSADDEDEDAEQSLLAPGVGNEGLQTIVQQAAKKRNKKQRLADKRRKKEAILGSEPGQSAQAQHFAAAAASSAQQDEDDEEADEEGYGSREEELDFEEEEGEDEFDEDEEDGMDFGEEGEEEAEEADDDELPPTAQLKLSAKEKRQLAAAQKAFEAEAEAAATKPKKKIAPVAVHDFLGEAQSAFTAFPAIAAAQKKQQQQPAAAPATKQSKSAKKAAAAAAAATAAVAAAPVAAAPSSPARGPSTPVRQQQQQQNAPKLIPDPAAVPAFHTPQPAKKSVSITGGAGGAATVAKPTAAPTSTKKNVQIVLARNEVKSFKRWSRDSVTVETPVLLAKPSPGSAIKPQSMQFFLKHNKNGRELAARQSALTAQLSQAAQEQQSSGNGSTPPVSPRRKAADFF